MTGRRRTRPARPARLDSADRRRRRRVLSCLRHLTSTIENERQSSRIRTVVCRNHPKTKRAQLPATLNHRREHRGAVGGTSADRAAVKGQGKAVKRLWAGSRKTAERQQKDSERARTRFEMSPALHVAGCDRLRWAVAGSGWICGAMPGTEPSGQMARSSSCWSICATYHPG